MKVQSFSHVGITVSDFNRFVQFYWDVFGCPLVGVADTPPERVRSFFGVGLEHERHGARSAGFACRAAPCSRSSGSSRRCRPTHPVEPRRPDALQLQRAQHPAMARPWLKAKGVEIVSTPEQSPRGHSFFFVRDFDGNLIELMDLRHMYHVLRLAGSARRVAVPPGDVQAVLREERVTGAG